MTRTRSAPPTIWSTWARAPASHGGTVVAEGTPDEVMQNSASLTGQYLSGLRQIPMPQAAPRAAATPATAG